MIEILIAGASLLGVVGLPAGYLILGRKYRWPKGVRRVRKFGEREITFIYGPGVEQGEAEVLEARTHAAIRSMENAWKQKRPDRGGPKLLKLGVHYQADKDFKPDANAWLGRTTRPVGGDPIPTMHVRESLIPVVLQRGQPVIHETLHALGADPAHQGPEWKDQADPGQQMEELAELLFLASPEAPRG
jgi:hypothetical protein